MSIVWLELWPKVQPYLIAVPQIDGFTIEFDELPIALSREMQLATMPCVACSRHVYPFKRIDGVAQERLRLNLTCSPGVTPGCAKSRTATLEYERLRTMQVHRPPAQLKLF